MANISAALIKELREITSAGMMDCKKALAENDGDIEAAKDWLRKKGLAAAAKKASRTASEGLVAVASDENSAVVIELNSETDFVSKNEDFQITALNIAKSALATDGSLEAIKATKTEGSSVTIEEEVKELVGSIGENLTLRRTEKLAVDKGVIATYVHNAVAPNLGKIVVLLAIETDGAKEKVNAFGRQLAMHVAAAKPESLDVANLDQALIDRERKVFEDQARASGKPDNIIEKMVEGRINKFYGEVVFLEQLFVIDGKTKISEAIKNAEKEFGCSINVKSYVRFTLGEGVEKEESDFAAEVAAAANG